MNPTDILREEHGLIEQFLDALDRAVQKLQKGERPPRQLFDKAAEFANAFTHDCHHFKEEHRMFVSLAQKKNGAIDGEIAALRQQHERGRELIAEMANALDGYAADQESQTSTLLEALEEYVPLLRQHIYREEQVFFPMVEQELSSGGQTALMLEFRKEHHQASVKLLTRCRSLVQKMAASVREG